VTEDAAGDGVGPVAARSVADVVSDMAKQHAHIIASPGGSVDLELKGVIPTGLPTLDWAIGRGGIPMGRLTVITGQEMIGKSTMALQLCAQAQRAGGVAVYIDREHKYDPRYAASLGVTLDGMIVTHPDHLEACFEAMESATLIVQERFGSVPVLVVLDSINAAISKAEFEAVYTKTHMASSARVFSLALPRLIGRLARLPVALVWLSQWRLKITSFGAFNEKVSGGNAVKYYSSLVINMKRVGDVKLGPTVIGTEVSARIDKNQVSHPNREALLQIMNDGTGFNHDHALIERAAAQGLIGIGKAQWYEMPDPGSPKGVARWQGAAGWRKLIARRPDLAERLEAEVRTKDGWDI